MICYVLVQLQCWELCCFKPYCYLITLRADATRSFDMAGQQQVMLQVQNAMQFMQLMQQFMLQAQAGGPPALPGFTIHAGAGGGASPAAGGSALASGGASPPCVTGSPSAGASDGAAPPSVDQPAPAQRTALTRHAVRPVTFTQFAAQVDNGAEDEDAPPGRKRAPKVKNGQVPKKSKNMINLCMRGGAPRLLTLTGDFLELAHKLMLDWQVSYSVDCVQGWICTCMDRSVEASNRAEAIRRMRD